MIDKTFVYENVIPELKRKGRNIDILLIQNLFESKETEIVKELKKYQNTDGGIGNALEPDVRMPNSSILATNKAVMILEDIKDVAVKENLIKDFVAYYENNYDTENKRFNMVSKEVNDYPRAIWWNYEDLDKNFPFGNPDPEVIGFLFQNRRYLKNLDINSLINDVVTFVRSDSFLKQGFHTLMSVMLFYNRVDEDIQNLIHDNLHEYVDQEIEAYIGKWEEYSLEPYKIYLINRHYTQRHQSVLKENLNGLLKKVKDLTVMPNWNWYQFDEVFEEAKYDWRGYLYYQIIKALRYERR